MFFEDLLLQNKILWIVVVFAQLEY